MKKFKFKFQSILKLKRAQEDALKNELGQLQKEKQAYLNNIDETNKGIDHYYLEQETLLKSATGKEAQAYPEYIWGNFGKRKKLENELMLLEKRVQAKQEELAKARGDVKVFEKLEEESKEKHYKEENKKEEANREDLFNIRKFYG